MEKKIEMEENPSLKGKLAIITGGSSGIGKASAELLKKAGATVINLDVKSQRHSFSTFIKCDIASKEDMSHATRKVYAEWGVPDILVSNAGIGVHETLIHGDPDKWEKVIQVNIIGALRFIRSFTEQMMEVKKGDVVFVTSVAATKVYPYGGVYAATKVALEKIAGTLRLESAPYLRVITISPGLVETEFLETELSGPRNIEEWKGLNPVQVAKALLYALTAPVSVAVNKIVLRPLGQDF